MMKRQSSKKKVNVLLPYPVGRPYTYDSGGYDLSEGEFALVSIGKRESIGVIYGGDVDQAVPEHKIKSVICRYELPPLSIDHLRFMQWVADYTLSDVGSVLKMTLPQVAENLIKKPLKKADVLPCTEIKFFESTLDLSPSQKAAADKLSQAVKAEKFSCSLLDGVTGSGKTEVYFEAIATAFQKGKQVLVLLPEIGLSSAVLKRFEDRFGVKPAVWHSDVTPAHKRKIWKGVLEGHTRCVVGARSALFLPFSDLGLIVVDEEHDASYKQEDGVIYNARDMAIVRANIGKMPIVLASATPSLETMQNVWHKKYQHIVLKDRFGDATMPNIYMIDMRQEKTTSQTFLSETLRQALKDTKERAEQSLLFLNRRGYAPLTLCRKCSHRFECASCSAWLVQHRKTGRLHCHHCDFDMPVPKSCPACGADESLAACGPGVERIAEEVSMIMPDAQVMILSSDITNSPKLMQEAFEQILNGDVDVIIGTQMIAKGHHFPNLTTVGVVDADIGLSGGDLRAAERTFQLLHQVSGRAGRAAVKGHVYMQSYMPDHKVMQALSGNDRDTFLKAEAEERQEADMPPYGKLAALIVSGAKEDDVKTLCRMLSRNAPRYDDVVILGPAVAMMSFLRGRHRWRFLIKADRHIHMQKLIDDWIATVKCSSNVQLKIDIDPQSFF